MRSERLQHWSTGETLAAFVRGLFGLDQPDFSKDTNILLERPPGM